MLQKEEEYKRKNKLFGAWLPKDVHEWFVNYLQVKSVGASTGERFRQWIYKVQDQNPSVPRFKPETTLSEWICLRGFPPEATEEAQNRRCEICRKTYPDESRARGNRFVLLYFSSYLNLIPKLTLSSSSNPRCL